MHTDLLSKRHVRSQRAVPSNALAALLVLAATVLPQAHAAGVSGQGTWETSLQGRDLDGNASNGYEAYYDTALNITWLADTSAFSGAWNEANAWAANLNLYGVTGWRLPAMVDTRTPGCNYSTYGGTDCGFDVQTKDATTGQVYSEMAYMYYVTLGNKKGEASSGVNSGPFGGMQHVYWFGVEDAADTTKAWYFVENSGSQNINTKSGWMSVWAVHDGDIASIATVPEPESAGLVLTGLLVLAARQVRRRPA
jgi:hypothetical protein